MLQRFFEAEIFEAGGLELGALPLGVFGLWPKAGVTPCSGFLCLKS